MNHWLLRWIRDRWLDFGRCLKKALNLPGHLLLAKSRHARQPGLLQFLHEDSASTVGVLGLLVHWVLSPDPRVSAEWKDSVRQAFEAICQRVLSREAWVAELAFDVEARTCPGLFAEGERRLELQVTNGVVDLTPMVQARTEHPLVQWVLECLTWEPRCGATRSGPGHSVA